MKKEASKLRTLSMLGGSIGLPVGMDVMQHDDFSLDSFDKKRIGNAILNAALGAGSGHLISSGKGKKIVEGAGLAALAPAKDLLLNLQDTPQKLNETLDTAKTDLKLNRSLMAILGAGALGLGGLGVAKYLMSKDPKTEMGSIKLKLPGKKGEPGTDAEVSLPIDMPQMSPSLLEGLNRGVRMQARKNVKANSYKRDPETGKNIPIEEWEAKYKDQLMENANADILKVAATREWAEGAGSIVSGLLGANIGAGIGNAVSSPENKVMGTLAGAAIGGLGPNLLGRLIANIMGDRTDTEQAKHDKHNALEEYLIPGYASYQNERRVNQVPDQEKNKLSFANTLSSDAAFSDDDEDEASYYKYANAPIPPQGPPPPPRPKDATVPAQQGNPPSMERREVTTGPIPGSLRNRVNRAMAAVNNAARAAAINKTAYTIELYTYPEGGVKQASGIDMSAREEARGIMKRIYDEDPSFWPYGLEIPGHESLYLIRDNMTKAAAGFVGWQETIQDGKKVGSYSIGILPEYRNRGFAKEAVSKILQVKSACVDEVRAYVMKHNGPSHALADSLGVKVQEKF